MATDDFDDDFDDHDKPSGLGSTMRKALFAAVGAAFMTEEGLRSYVKDAKLPRDITRYVLNNAHSAKEQLFTYVARDVSELLRKSDLPKAIAQFLESHTMELSIRFRPLADAPAVVTADEDTAAPEETATSDSEDLAQEES